MAFSVNCEIEEEESINSVAKQFRRFDVVADDSDHLYLRTNRSHKDNNNGGDCLIKPSSGVHKKIMKEWKVLEENLPDSIYVRVYERRIDLLRAVIIGSAGTPYHDGLFFFDLAFPPDYPARPPQVSYRSFGLRLNPNLYANGRVCLSLLNTWVGNKREKWNPAESTVLQVLVSIQGLVLNEKPYYNEPGSGVFPGGSKKSMAYSENAFVLSCKTMVYLLRRPPKNFDDFVASHFRERARVILTASNAYLNGTARVGYYTDDGSGSGSSSSSSSSSVNVSSHFKSMMKSWYPEMVASFNKTGASLGNFVEQLKVEKETASSLSLKKKKKTASSRPLVIAKTTCGVSMMIGKVKKILGLKKVGKGHENRIMVKSS
ncbi:putative ubiquitin-conjugating enzyme E2 38 [Cornus florida]|uniref:putative ubiquitin-conjugating enzyme E2 38 n=1 Tax=Cornus florida TaxID=4283 RepID=UPI00289C87D1|nr:putative ubiquitin-conjugating enzyme E2 38 [Cornus florida]